MKGYYLEPTKQQLHENWRVFAKKHLVPHTQTCASCNMVVEITKLHTLLPGKIGSTYREVTWELFFICPGCRKSNIFTGGSHLNTATRQKITAKYREIPGGIDFLSFMVEDYWYFVYPLRYLTYAIFLGLLCYSIAAFIF